MQAARRNPAGWQIKGSGRPEEDPGPAASATRSDDRQSNVDIAARCVGIRAHLVRLLDQRLGFRAGEARQRYGKVDVETEAAGRARADADGRGHRGVGWNLRPALRGYELHRADEAGGIARRKQLLGIVAGAASAAEFLRRGELDVERAIEGRGMAVAAAGGLCAGLVEDVH